MTIAVIHDPTRVYAVTAYWPGSALPYYDWSQRRWVVAPTPACYLPVPLDAAAPGGDLLRLRVPDVLAEGEVIVQLGVMMGAAFRSIDCEVLAAPAYAAAGGTGRGTGGPVDAGPSFQVSTHGDPA